MGFEIEDYLQSLGFWVRVEGLVKTLGRFTLFMEGLLFFVHLLPDRVLVQWFLFVLCSVTRGHPSPRPLNAHQYALNTFPKS